MSTTGSPPKAGRKEWLGLGILALPTFVVAIDLFVLMLALPSLAIELGADGNQQLWAMDTYGFLVAGLLITMGTLGDRIGRRRLLLIGAALFAVASLLCAYATTPEMLIGARALLGIAGATLGPSTLALIATLFQDPKQQAVAFGLWGSTFTLGALLGPVIGGVMISSWWWGSVFLIGPPVMLITLLVGPKVLPEFKNPQPGRIDLASVALSLLALLPTVFALKEFARVGLDVTAVVALVVGVASGVLFVRRQRRLADPLLDLALIRNRTIGTSLGGQVCYSLTGGGIMLLMMLYFQLVQGMSTLEAGLAMVPGMLGGTLGFIVAPKLAARFRPAHVISAGLAIVALVMISFTFVEPGTGSPLLIAGFAVMSFCGAPMAGLGTGLAVGSAPLEKAGSAGSLAQMANEFGGTLGVAILGTIGTAVYRLQVAGDVPASLPGDTATVARDSLAGAVSSTSGLPATVVDPLLVAARDAFVSGLHVAAAIGAVLTLSAAVAVLTGLKHLPPIGGAPAPSEDAQDQVDQSVPAESH